MARNSPLFESEVERRGKLKTDTAGEYHFNSTVDVIDFVAGSIRRSHLKYSDITKGTGGDVKSAGTVGKLASGQTKYPRFSTIFGTAGALGLEVVLTKQRRPN